MTDLPGFLPCSVVTGPGLLYKESEKKFFRSLFRMNMKLKRMIRLIECGVFGL